MENIIQETLDKCFYFVKENNVYNNIVDFIFYINTNYSANKSFILFYFFFHNI